MSKNTTPPSVEPLVFAVPATAPKTGALKGSRAIEALAVADTYKSLFHWAISNHLRSGGNKTASIVASDTNIFHSMVRQAHRPNEKAVHVRAFRGSKDGYLFFLPTGILWAFKKPLLFLPLERIMAISYTSVLQRTFNMMVEIDLGDDKTEELEFAMLDQEDYGKIDESYVRRHGLQDRSMAVQRKAKIELPENLREAKKKGGAGAAANEEEPDDGLTELQRAEQQLQDDEDEMEEDYEPDSAGESDDEGASSEEDEDDYEEGAGEEGDNDDNDDDGEEDDGEEDDV